MSPSPQVWSLPDSRCALASVAAKALPSLLVAAVVPAICFLVGRALWGLAGAITLALLWNGTCQAVRRLRGRRLSGLLIIGLIGLVLRATVSLALNSARMYFLAPAIVTGLSGIVYVGSGFTSSPLMARVLADLVPETVLDVENPRLATLLRNGCVFYGAEQMLIAGLTIWMVINLSTTTYVAVHPIVSTGMLGLLLAFGFPFLRRELGAVRQSALAPLAGEPAPAG